MPDFLLPDLGEGLTEAEIVGWLVQVGDQVTVDQPVVEVETAKASVEVPVPFAGTVTVLHAEPGTLLAVGSPLITVAEADQPLGGLREPGIEIAPAPTPSAGATGAEGSGNVLIGYGTPQPSGTRRRRPRRPTPSSAPTRPTGLGPSPTASAEVEGSAAYPAEAGPTGAGPSDAESSLGTGGQVVRVISPLARRIARDARLDLTTVTGSGPDGLIMRTDIRRALLERTDVPHLPETAPTEAPEFDRIPLTGIRRFAADKLTRSRREIPEATIWVDVDATGFLAARKALNALNTDPAPQKAQPVSLVALLGRFVITGLRRFPELNATVEDGEIHRYRPVHLGFAAQTDRGLVVPVLHHADRLTTRTLAAAFAEKTAVARDGRLSPADLTGGTFTVNNYGVFGTDGAAAIINHPEAAILGIGRIIDRPWVVEGQLAVRKVTQLTLSFDHRVCDGAVAGGFLRHVADCVENPVTALGDL